MPTATDTDTFPTQAAGLMQGFNRHGLPGMVIAVLFLYIAGGFYLGLAGLSANTAATNRMALGQEAMTAAMNRLADAIEKENRK